jgi:NADH-quinone oxidoreductase subunit D
MREMDESVYMIRQLIEMLPEGPINVDDRRCTLPDKRLVYTEIESLINHFKLIMEGPDVPVGEVYTAHEAPNGELGFYLVSTGGGTPYKLHVRSPSFVHMGRRREDARRLPARRHHSDLRLGQHDRRRV